MKNNDLTGEPKGKLKEWGGGKPTLGPNSMIKRPSPTALFVLVNKGIWPPDVDRPCLVKRTIATRTEVDGEGEPIRGYDILKRVVKNGKSFWVNMNGLLYEIQNDDLWVYCEDLFSGIDKNKGNDPDMQGLLEKVVDEDQQDDMINPPTQDLQEHERLDMDLATIEWNWKHVKKLINILLDKYNEDHEVIEGLKRRISKIEGYFDIINIPNTPSDPLKPYPPYQPYPSTPSQPGWPFPQLPLCPWPGYPLGPVVTYGGQTNQPPFNPGNTVSDVK